MGRFAASDKTRTSWSSAGIPDRERPRLVAATASFTSVTNTSIHERARRAPWEADPRVHGVVHPRCAVRGNPGRRCPARHRRRRPVPVTGCASPGLRTSCPELSETVWVWVSAGSMVMTPTVRDDVIQWRPPARDDTHWAPSTSRSALTWLPTACQETPWPRRSGGRSCWRKQQQGGTGRGDTIPEPAPRSRFDYVLYDHHFAVMPGSTRVLPRLQRPPVDPCRAGPAPGATVLTSPASADVFGQGDDDA
jgi:hypothetical protein